MAGPSVVIAAGLWRGFDVSVEPPSQRYPICHRKTHSEAAELAGLIAKAEGWPVVDRTVAGVVHG